MVKQSNSVLHHSFTLQFMTRRRSWMKRGMCRSLPSWARYFGIRPCLMMAIIFSWSIWTLTSFCLKMAFHPVHHSMSKASVLSSSSRPQSPSWTSATESAPPSTQAWSLSPPFRVPHEQVLCQNRSNIAAANAGCCYTPCQNEPN